MRQCHVNQIHFNNNDDNNLSLRQYYYASPLQSMKPHIVARFSDIAVIYLPIVRMLCVSYPLFICLFSSFYVFYVQFFTMCIRCVIHDNNRIRFFLHAAPHKAIVCASVLLRIIVGDYRPNVTGRMSRRRCPDGRGGQCMDTIYRPRQRSFAIHWDFIDFTQHPSVRRRGP